MLGREVLPDGTVRLSSPRCSFVFRRLRPGTLLVTIAGDDKGELGTMPLDELSGEIARFQSLALFVDARAVRGVDTRVSEEWTAWFTANRTRLRTVSILVGSRFMHLVVATTKLLSRTGELIRIHEAERAFVAAVAADCPGFGQLPSA